MSVNVDKAPNAPALTGRASSDMVAMFKHLRELTRVVNQLRERTGGTTDTVAATVTTANTAASTAAASQAGATIPTEGGSITLTPSNPLSYTLIDSDTATINVAGHTRTGAASALIAGSVATPVTRGLSYYVYYSDAGDLGGAQTFLASNPLSVVTGTAGYRIIGTISIPIYSYGDRDTGPPA